MKKFNGMILFVGILLCVVGITSIVYADSLASRLAGKILLQVEENGEAWYINPANQQRYFLGRPNDAFELMRKLGLGIANKDLEQIPIATDSPVVPTKQSSTNTTTEDQQESGKTWQITHTLSGNKDINTEPFTFTNGSWVKLKINYQNPNNYHSHFAVKIVNPGDVFDSDFVVNELIESGKTFKLETNIYNKKNDTPYYLEISADADWIVEIKENK